MQRRISRLAVSLALLALLVIASSISGCLWWKPAAPEPPELAPPVYQQREWLFNGSNARELVAEQCAFGYRIPGTPNNTRCAQWIFEMLEEYNFTAKWQNFNGGAGYLNNMPLHNVIGTKRGTTNATLVLAAHYDTRPWADTPYGGAWRDPDKPVMGANDGASGVAVLLELARVLSNQNFTITIKMMFFDAEDSGGHEQGLDWCLGSSYAAAPAQLSEEEIKNINKCGFILLDMVGDKALSLPRERNSNKTLQDNIWNIAAAANVSQFKNISGGAILDDHIPFLRRGVKAVDIIHYPFPPTWHTTRDTIENVSPESLGAVGTVMERTIYLMDAQ